MRGRGHRFGTVELARLWLSYQRYALLLFALAAAPIAAMVTLAPASWLWWPLAAAPSLAAAVFASSVYRRWPRKLRATALAARRIESGRFAPRRLREYCGDPCFRVVAAEILTRAGYSRRERDQMIREFARDLREPVFLLEVDHLGGTVRIDGDSVGDLATPTRSKETGS